MSEEQKDEQYQNKKRKRKQRPESYKDDDYTF